MVFRTPQGYGTPLARARCFLRDLSSCRGSPGGYDGKFHGRSFPPRSPRGELNAVAVKSLAMAANRKRRMSSTLDLQNTRTGLPGVFAAVAIVLVVASGCGAGSDTENQPVRLQVLVGAYAPRGLQFDTGAHARGRMGHRAAQFRRVKTQGSAQVSSGIPST